MTKTEIHAALKAAGVKLKGINAYSVDELAALHAKQFGKGTPPIPPPTAPGASSAPASNAKEAEPQMRVLFFENSGWCEELRKSYFQGVHHPSNVKEYLALRKFAAREGAII